MFIRNVCIVLVVLCLVCIVYVMKNETIWENDNNNQPMKIVNELYEKERLNRMKRILFYTPFFGDKPWYVLHLSRPLPSYTQTCGCSFNNCEVTYDINDFNRSDIVFFHGRDMVDLDLLNKNRPKYQLWVYFILENPFHAPSVTPLDEFFNLTSSYRLSSDIRFPYKAYVSLPPSKINRNDTPINYADGKTKQIAWAVSNCGHLRDQLAYKLYVFGLQIDNFGKCEFPFANNHYIPRDTTPPPYNEYKFFFAAENRMCQDYVTGKYWEDALYHNTIPIVLGGADYSNPQLAIPGSYIDALKFSSPKTLSEYLLKIDKNDTLFNEHFKWKRLWGVPNLRTEGCSWFLCELCEKLHSHSWKFKKKPLISTISVENECKPTEDYFRNWITKV